MLEAVPRAPAHDPHVLHCRMAVDDEVAVRSLLVLANASFHKRRVLQGREAKAKILANVSQSFLADYPLAVSGIENRTARVVGDLEPAPAAARNSVTKASPVIGPHRQMRVGKTIIPGRRTKEKDILPGRLHEVTDGLRE